MAGSTSVETGKDFGEKMQDMNMKGYTALGVAMGVSTGLLAKMTTFSEPKTSLEIAEAACLKERYVREWLGIMVSGGIVDLDSMSQTFFLPHHRRPFFTPGCPEEDIAMEFRCIPMLASAFDEVGKCFKLDGPRGVPYSHYNYRPAMSDIRLKLHLINELATFPGLQVQLESGIRVVDLACGIGISTMLMAKRYPQSTFIGLDLDDVAIENANQEAARSELSNVEFVCCSALELPAEWSGSFDFLFIYNAVHDAYRPDKFLQEGLRILKPGAKAMIQEPRCLSNMGDAAGNPRQAVLFTFSLFSCLPTSLDSDDALGMGAAWGKESCHKMITEMGFEVVSVEPSVQGSTWKFSCIKPMTESS